MAAAQETQGLGLQSFYDVIQRVGEERGLMDPDAEEQVCRTCPDRSSLSALRSLMSATGVTDDVTSSL